MLAADRNTLATDGKLVVLPVAAGAKIFAGALVVANATGYVAPGSTATTLTYLGRAEEYVDNTAGADGAATVRVRRGSAFYWKNAAGDLVTQASLGKPCYIVDDETVSKTNAGGNTQSLAGTVIGVDAGGVWVE
ncbi:hypothetical protein [Dyella lutea]|uniref:Bacteriophage lambda head decoration protein D n=1 Tax=Dyella lutea TaxID=2950441 RepID=A0ABT1FDH1_9GAMM|nr:hypothetical protein [Dyella lutea]MCP1375384.1 hypothetical protein [Dyella lutea]